MTTRVKLTNTVMAGLLKEQAATPTSRMVWDAMVPKLCLRFQATGSAAWTVVYRTFGGRQGVTRQHRLGGAKEMTLDAARKAALAALGEMAQGHDPAAKRAEVRAAITVSEAVERHIATLTNHRNGKQIASQLRREFVAQFGHLPLARLTRADVVERIEEVIKSGRPGAAADLRKNVNSMLTQSVNRGLIQASPLAGFKMAKKTKVELLASEERGGKAMSADEIALLHEARGMLSHIDSAFLLLTLTSGFRRQESERLEWTEVSEDEFGIGTWAMVTPEKAKNATKHVAFLLPEVVAALRSIPVEGPFIFGGAKAWGSDRKSLNTKMHDAVQAAWKARGNEGEAPHFTIKDFRTTFRTMLSEAGVEHHLAERMINHTLDDLTKRYDRSKQLEQRAEGTRKVAALLLPQRPRPVLVAA